MINLILIIAKLQSLFMKICFSRGCQNPIAVFDDCPGEGDLITIGKRGHRYMDQVKESGNMGTGGGTI